MTETARPTAMHARFAGHPLVVRAHRLKRRLLRADQRLWRTYLASAREPKLHIGGGWHRLEGWLNTDLAAIPGVVIMDATRPFPFETGTFAYMFSEHMIEHVGYEQGLAMLRECHRTLKPGGVIRITTPDLAAITKLYAGARGGVQDRYLAWFYQAFLPPRHPRTPASVLNAHFRMWGHQFLYDEHTLSGSLTAAGFSRVVRRPLGESAHVPLRAIENTARYPEGLLDFESVALEAEK